MFRAFKTSLAFGLVAQFLFGTISVSGAVILESRIITTDGVVEIQRVQQSASETVIEIRGFDKSGRAIPGQEHFSSPPVILERSNISYPGVNFRRGAIFASVVCGSLLGGTMGDHSFQAIYPIFDEGALTTFAAQYGETFGQVAGAILSFIGIRASTIGIDGTNSKKVIKTIEKASSLPNAVLKVPVTSAEVFDLLNHPTDWTSAKAHAESKNHPGTTPRHEGSGSSSWSSGPNPSDSNSASVSGPQPGGDSGN